MSLEPKAAKVLNEKNKKKRGGVVYIFLLFSDCNCRQVENNKENKLNINGIYRFRAEDRKNIQGEEGWGDGDTLSYPEAIYLIVSQRILLNTKFVYIIIKPFT